MPDNYQSTMLYVWVNVLCLIVLAVIFVGIIRYGTRNKRSSFLRIMFCLISVHSIFDSLWALMSGGVIKANETAAYFFNGVCFVSLIGAIVIWGLYSETFIIRNNPIKPIAMVVMFVPLAISAIYIVTSFIHHGAYYITPDMHYVRGKYYFYALGLPYAYFCYVSIRSLVLSALKKYYSYRRILILMFFYSIIVCGFFAVQVLLNSGIPVVCGGATIALLLVYLETLHGKITVDSLTGLANRSSLERTLNMRLKDENEGKKLYFMMMDIDNFKSINDLYGHIEGDNALKTVAGILQKHAPQNFLVARYGGDEFAALGITDDENEVIALVHNIHARLEEYNEREDRKYDMSISVGYACKEDGYYTVPDLINAADEELYKVKAKKKVNFGGGADFAASPPPLSR